MKKNGFTLIELLATITILSLIMIVAVPNVMSTIENNKKRTYVEDAKKMLTLAEYRLRSDSSIPLPTSGQCIVVTLSALDLTEFDEGPEGGDYEFSNSYALIVYSSSTYKYYATLTERYNTNKIKGIQNIARETLNQETALNQVKQFTSSISLPVLNSNTSYPGGTCTVKRIINYQK